MAANSPWLKRRIYTVVPLFFTCIAVIYLSKSPSPRWHKVVGENVAIIPLGAAFKSAVGQGNSPREQAANATLGFERVLAVSTGPSWRTRGLSSAAAYTGLEIEIPIQAQNPPELLGAFERVVSKDPAKHGSATAWLAHLDMLKYVIASGYESAFIVEDDVDWDIRIFDQIRLFSDSVRSFLNTDPADPNPYGRGWDVLWLGHCGELAKEADNQLLRYQDETRPTIDQYGGWSKQYLRQSVPEGKRIVQEASQPVCTFGYGITRESAQKMLTFLGQGNDEAYDVAVQHHCTQGDLKCITVNPEIMHHYEPDPEHGYVSQVKQGDGRGQSANERDYEDFKGSTSNIVHSARCRSIFGETCLAPPWEFEQH